MSNQPPNPPNPPDPSGDDPSWPASPPTSGDQPPAQPPAQPPSQPPNQPPSQPPNQGQQPGDGGFGGQGMPPPPPGGGDGGMIPAGPYSATDAIAYGWRKFVANMGPIIAATLLLFVGLIVVSLVLTFITGGFDRAVAFESPSVVDRLVNLLVQFLGLLISAAIIRMSLAIVDGRTFDLGEFFRMEQMGQVVIAAILVALATIIVGFIPILGFLLNILISFFGLFIMFFILDDGQEAIEGITSSVNFVAANVGPLVLLMLLSTVVVIVGALLCGVGLLAAIPVVVIAQAYTFRRLRNQPVSA